MPPRKDLGAILVEEDVLDQKDLERIARGKDNARRPLWGVIVESDLATPEQIFRALSARFGVPVVSDERLAEVAPPEALKRALSRAEALIAGLFPVDLSADGQRATVVMVDPSDEQTLADFLTRAQVPEGRALLARRDAITRAIERVWGETTAVVTPLPPGRRKPAPSKSSPQVVVPISDDDVTGTVKLDPSLQAELSRLPPRAPSPDDALTPLPQRRPKRPTPQPTAAEPTRQVETPSEALRAEERLTRALIETIEALATELEARVVGGSGAGVEMARLSRRVARQLGLPRRLADEIGVAAQLFALDRQMRQIEGAGSADVFAELGWTAAGADGLLPILRALTAASSGFGRLAPGTQAPPVPIGARIIGAVADYQELGAAATAMSDLDAISQLLRASPAGAQVVDALLRVLESDRGDKTPATPTMLPATSMLKEKPAREPARDPEERREDEKTVRKPYPRKEGE
ncbi:MAG TPA: hypothetical protein VN947_29220 [Polyangia bacterium]|nr:hypothetical protein [Polyangia bacterium]